MLSMNDGAMETVELMWVDVWCMLDWIELCHKTTEMHFPSIVAQLVGTQNEVGR